MIVIIRNARVLMTLPGPGALRGAAMNDWPLLERGDVLIEDGLVTSIGAAIPPPRGATVVEAGGRVLMPAFVDCHTHACWAGSRLDEWELGLRGVRYLEILRQGGGIMSTVRAVRAATEAALTESLVANIAHMARFGSATVEVKSGYGLSTEDELKMLRAIRAAQSLVAPTLVPTALIGHAIDASDGSAEQFVERTIGETLPAVHDEFPGIAIDAYCEKSAWSLDQCRRLFERARELGHPIRVHADQFNALGIIDLNSEWSRSAGAFRSIDHLEATSVESLGTLAGTPTIGTLLPCAGFHTDRRYANGRALIDAGGAAALATNANPGSAPCFSMQLAIALAVRFNGLTAREAIAAATVNAAAVLGLTDRGYIAPGARADLLLLSCKDERSLAYEFGGDQIDSLFIAGKRVR